MTHSVGYTPKQAERICHALDRDMAKIEDTTTRMLRSVTDHGETVDILLEELRYIVHVLQETVHRRTRRS